ncbi:hypothetical protein Gotur_017844 [Gossypium turneri]
MDASLILFDDNHISATTLPMADGRVLEPLIPEIRGVPKRGLILACVLHAKGVQSHSRTSVIARLPVDEPIISGLAVDEPIISGLVVVQGKVDLYMGMLGKASN